MDPEIEEKLRIHKQALRQILAAQVEIMRHLQQTGNELIRSTVFDDEIYEALEMIETL